MTCAPSEDSDQPGHQPSLISLCWVLLGKVGDPSFLQANSKDWSDWADAQADLSLRWPQRSFCWFCYVMAQLFSDNPVKSSRVVVCDQLPCFVVSYLGFHTLPKSIGLNARLKWVKVCWNLDWFDVVEPKWSKTWQNKQNEQSQWAPSEDSDQLGIRPVWSVFTMGLMCS